MKTAVIFKTIDDLVDGWCERRVLCPLRYLLQSYPFANGLTEDWHRLYESLKEVRAFCREELNDDERTQIGNVIVAIQQLLERS